MMGADIANDGKMVHTTGFELLDLLFNGKKGFGILNGRGIQRRTPRGEHCEEA